MSKFLAVVKVDPFGTCSSSCRNTALGPVHKKNGTRFTVRERSLIDVALIIRVDGFLE